MEELTTIFLFNISDEENEEMKCNICNKYLSVPPIFYNKSLGNICGRCHVATEVEEMKKLNSKKSIMERQKIFETVAQNLTFPCSFRMKGCTQKLKWGEVEAHEVSCSFKSIMCPLSDNQFLMEEDEACYWAGEATDLITHICKQHKNYFTNNLRIILGIETASILGPLFGTDAITNEPKFQSKFLYTSLLDSYAIIAFHYDKSYNYYHIQVLSDLSYYKCKSLEYQLEIFDDNKRNSITFPTVPIKSMVTFFGKSYNEDSLEIDLNYINKILRMPHFISIDLRLMKNNEIISLRNRRNSSLLPAPQMCDGKFLNNMKCSECDEYLAPPIFFCEMGHNVCSDCKIRQHDGVICDICGCSWSVTRNITLERLTALVNFPCKNRGVGCLFVAPMPDILEHESRCRPVGLQLRHCPFETCQWEDYEIRSHLKKKHTILITNELAKLEAQSFYIFYDDNIFILEIEFEYAAGYGFKLTCCDTEKLKYRYELQMIDTEVEMKMAGKISFGHICKPEYLINEAFIGIIIPYSLLPQLFSNCSKIMFKLNIFSIDEISN